MIQMFMAGGWMMIPIVISSLVAVAIVLERGWWFYHMPPNDHADRLINLVTQGKLTDALAFNDREPHFMLRVLKAGLQARTAAPEKAMEAAAIAELSRMKRGMPALDTIITLAPLLGLLGTIIGMIDSFGVMADQGIGQPHAVTGGVAEALICTAAGIFVAVIALVPYNYFQARIEQYTELIEYYATRLESALQETLEKTPRETPSRPKKESPN
ncbi:MotA/TolQ/ExbB proton channel family protein [Candidatus Nitronereus thalassa]|uniref:MotA/TolQ/ExbB proton channel family protein n=1 Tax=Candidatus Nitronereus thalassa TaxID=3020898 RepID=A0ABU3KBM8_9BACT|nr:MotA/TolQ/ExbB proton channel family protein [Candidatus Nitronereus thalassa]MDT7043915.1 MotA/TolQ/ExbB proton channel family protein [Candidatus Nitronereus thalassa]